MAKTVKWIDPEGREVPAKYVSAYDKAREAAARRIHARFMRCLDQLESCYCSSMQDIEALEKIPVRDGKMPGGAKGNLQFCSFDGSIRVERSARYEVVFDARLQAARDLINQLIEEKAQGIDVDLAEIVRGVFEPSSAGMLSASRVLGLFRYRVSAPKWVQAMDLIRESISTRRGKTLLSCSVRGPDGVFKPILLDLARCAGLYSAAAAGKEEQP